MRTTTCETPACSVSSGPTGSVRFADTSATIEDRGPGQPANGRLGRCAGGRRGFECAGDSLRALQQHQMGTAPTAEVSASREGPVGFFFSRGTAAPAKAAIGRRRAPKGALNLLTNQEQNERTAGGAFGKLAGKAKEAAGAIVGNDDLAREGRLQQAQSEAEIDAQRNAAEAEQRREEANLVEEKTEVELERQRLQNEVTAQEREDQIERDRQAAERQAAAQAQRKQAVAEEERRTLESAADSAEERAERERLAAAKESIRLEQEAQQAEAAANTIDPEENR